LVKVKENQNEAKIKNDFLINSQFLKKNLLNSHMKYGPFVFVNFKKCKNLWFENGDFIL